MSIRFFIALADKLDEAIRNQNTAMRLAIPPIERVAVTR